MTSEPTDDDALTNLGALSCPADGVTLRDAPGEFRCPSCGYAVPIDPVPMPPEFDGDDIDDKRRR